MDEYILLRVVFILAISALVVTGFYVAAKLTGAIPEPIRIAALAPSLAGISYMIGLLKFNYVPYWQDIFSVCAMLVLYFLFASLFSDNPWIKFKDN